jgi:hypothetical protein
MRRLWGLVLEADLNRERASELVGISSVTWGRWEKNEDALRESNVEMLVAKSAELGLPGVTPEWLRYGAGEGPPIIGTPPVVTAPRKALRKGKKGIKQPKPSTKNRKDGTG